MIERLPGVSRAVSIVLLLVSGSARAEEPWVIGAAVGPEMDRARLSSDEGVRLGASARLDAGYRIIDQAAIGIHFGVGCVRSNVYYSDSYGDPINAPVLPLEIGVGAQFVIIDRALVAPWAGYVDIGGHRYNAAGVELGYDVLTRGRDRISAVGSFTRAPDGFNSVSLGVAYRYW